MNQNNKKIRIAIQKNGKLKDESLKLLESKGFKFDLENGNTLIAPCKNADIEIIFVRHKDIPQYIQFGAADIGIVGYNILYEDIFKIEIIKKLGFGQCSLVIAVPKNSSFKKIEDLEEERIATSYPNSLKKFLKEKNISVALVPISGSVEITPKLNLSDAICDITQTGNTLIENDLIIIDKVLESEAVLIKSSFSDKQKDIQLNSFIDLLTGISNDEINEIFDKIPYKKILKIAKNIQEKLKINPSLAKKEKSNDEWGWVSKADTDIQRIILDYFKNSSLKNEYVIKTEEKILEKESNSKKEIQLIIDPLDGTSSFIKQKETWGIMIGICDKKGILQYSWNLLSTGDIYTTNSNKSLNKKKSFKGKIQDKETILIDVYDYKSDANEKFGNIFEKKLGIKAEQYKQTSYPSAIWAGWQLFKGELDGLLWLPSDKGKKYYPDYDLIFLEALEKQGLKIRLGKIDGNNAMLVIASTEEDVELLWQTGLQMISKDQQKKIQISKNPLQITSSIKEVT